MSLDQDSQTWPDAVSTDPIIEARRQIEICNACRYCEGFCAVFPAIAKEKIFADGDITQLANLCHNCRGCYYSCQYAAPHDWAVNLPRALAEARTDSWERLAWPSGLNGLFQRRGVAIALALAAGLTVLFLLIAQLPRGDGDGFYAVMSHGVMVAIFTPAFLLPLVSIGVSLRRYWHEVGGTRISWHDVTSAVRSVAVLRNLSGGQGQGCNYEDGDRYSDRRRWMHQITMYGFLLCFASTASGTILHYGFGIEAPYPLFSIPKLLGIPGGLMLVIGCTGLMLQKIKADPELGAPGRLGGEMGFVLLLGLTGATGLALYAATGTAAVPALLAVHLGTVLAFFLLMPFSKMVHGFYRFAALLRDAQLQDGRRQEPSADTL